MAISIRDDYMPGTARGNTCYACGAGRRTLPGGIYERVVDLEQTIDFEGFLMICETCTREAAHKLGMADNDAAPELLERLAVADAECQTLRAERDEALHLVALIRSFDDKHAHEPIETPPDSATLAAARAATAKRAPRPKTQP